MHLTGGAVADIVALGASDYAPTLSHRTASPLRSESLSSLSDNWKIAVRRALEAVLLRIIHVVLDLHEGGLERVVTDLVLDATRRGHQPHVVCLRRAGQLAAELGPAQVTVVPRQGRLSLLAPAALAAFLSRLAPDVVHLHSGVCFKAAYASRLARVGPIVFTDHGRPLPDPLIHRGLDGIGARLTDHVVAVSAPLAEYLVSRLLVPRDKISIIPNGIHLLHPPSDLEAGRVRRELSLPEEALVVGTVGRLDPIKAYDRLLHAFAQLRSGSSVGPKPDTLLLIGDGPERGRLERLVGELELGDSVRFLGWRTDVSRILGAMDVFVLPSDSEGTSISLLEAMAAGRAVVATAVGGTPDVIGAGDAGRLVAPGDVGALADGLREVLEDAEHRRQLGQHARARVEERYSFEAMANAYELLYHGLRNG